jgi:hypothetical protein
MSLFLTVLAFASCNQTTKTENKEKELTAKEIELLKKENELLKKEQELKTQTYKVETDNQTEGIQQTNNSDNLDFLKSTNGKYPYEIKLLKNPILTQRLKKLIGNRYNFLKDTWAVENPIEVKDNIFVAYGCQAHNCGSTNFIIIIDFYKDAMYAGIRENDNVKIYSEDGSDSRKLNDFASGDF